MAVPVLLAALVAAALAGRLVGSWTGGARRVDPAAHIVSGYEAYASLSSARELAGSLARLEPARTFLSGGGAAPFAEALLAWSADGQPPVSQSGLSAAGRVDAAIYPDGSFLVVADLGRAGLAQRLRRAAPGWSARLAARTPGLRYVAEAVPRRFEYRLGAVTLHLAFVDNLLLAASQERTLAKSLALAGRPGLAGAQAAALVAVRQPGEADSVGPEALRLRVLVATRALLDWTGLPAGLGGADYTMVELSMDERRLGLSAEIPLPDPAELAAAGTGTAAAIRALVAVASGNAEPGGAVGTAGIADKPASALPWGLPASTTSYLLVSAVPPAGLWNALRPFRGPETEAAYLAAERAARSAWGLGLDELLWSWPGAEFGWFGTAHGHQPVYHVAIEREALRAQVFARLAGGPLARWAARTVVDGQALTRLVLPAAVGRWLGLLGAGLDEAFYAVQDGRLFLCADSRVLVASLAELRQGQFLAPSTPSAPGADQAGAVPPTQLWTLAGRWRAAVAGLPGGAVPVDGPHLTAYFMVEDGLPAFVSHSAALATTMRRYGLGAYTLAAVPGALRLGLSALATPASGLAAVPGFPVPAGGRIDPGLQAGVSMGQPRAYWTSGRRLVASDVPAGARFELPLDDEGWVVLEIGPDGAVAAVWAVSARGTLYRCDATLAVEPGFPLSLRAPVPGPPAMAFGYLMVPVANEPALLMVDRAGAVRGRLLLRARARSPMAVSAEALAVVPRSFESLLYLFGVGGAALPGWPVRLAGIVSAPPAFGRAGQVATITDGGVLQVFDKAGRVAPGFPLELVGSYDAAPAWAAGWDSWYAVSTEGWLHRVPASGLDAFAGVGLPGLRRVALRRGPARESALAAVDLDGDGLEEVLVSGGGDALYAFSGDLAPLSGFPVPGAEPPRPLDLDGDGWTEWLARSLDDHLWAYVPR